jgi:hypothetical protein
MLLERSQQPLKVLRRATMVVARALLDLLA